eukprot:3788601-Pyramimonas_sp.AAC.1
MCLGVSSGGLAMCCIPLVSRELAGRFVDHGAEASAWGVPGCWVDQSCCLAGSSRGGRNALGP